MWDRGRSSSFPPLAATRERVLNAREVVQARDLEEGDLVPQSLRFHDLRQICAAILIDNGAHMEE